jgi:hypothetical protein
MRRRRPRYGELNDAARTYDGPYRPYDIVKEVAIATVVVLALAIALSVVFSSPDEKPSTIAQWSHQMPVDFATTAVAELDGTSTLAGYGPPYNHAANGQHIAFLYLAKWLGVSHPIDTAKDFVIGPLRTIPNAPALQAAVRRYVAASSSQQTAWTTAYGNALAKASVGANGLLRLPAGSFGPVPQMMNSLLALAQGGGLDGDLLTSSQFYQTDYTKPLLLLADGSALSTRAQAEHLLGTQWGMMNETGSYPGQVWLWLYTFWYQIEPFSSSSNADALVMAVMGVLSLGLVLIPFIPGIRSIPRVIPIHRLIWRDHYARERALAGSPPPPPPPEPLQAAAEA